MQVKNILYYIIEQIFCLKASEFNRLSSREKKAIRYIIKENNLKKLDHKKGYVTKISLNDTHNIKFDYASIKNFNLQVVQFIDLLTLYSENYYKYNYNFKRVKNIKLIAFIKYDYDIAYLYLICFNERDYKNLIDNFLKINSFKYKACFTKKERKLLYTLKNKQYYSSIAISETTYKETLEQEIKALEQEIKTLEQEIKTLEQEIKELETNKQDIVTIYKDICQYDIKKKSFIHKKIKIFENKLLYEKRTLLKELNLDLLDLNQDLKEQEYKLDSYITSIDYNQENIYKVNYIPTRTNSNYKRYEYY